MEYTLLSLEYSQPVTAWRGLMAQAAAHTRRRLYVYPSGRDASAAQVDLLSWLRQVYEVTAWEAPCLDAVPLLEFAGWTDERVASIPELETVLTAGSRRSQAQAQVDAWNSLRGPGLPPLRIVELDSLELPDFSAGQAPEAEAGGRALADDPHAQPCTRGGQPDGSLAWERVAVGGTFDRLHAGHRLLLAASALVCTASLFIGVTGDQLLAKKRHAELLETYDERCAAAVHFVQAVQPGLAVKTGALLDPRGVMQYGLRQAPTAAATEAGMQALVVSAETTAGAAEIQRQRAERGFAPLAVVVVGLVAATRALAGGKLSSTALRDEEAARLAKQ